MQSALSQAFSEPLLAAMPQLSEKLHQGVPSSNPALYLGHEVCKSTTALGLRAALHLERVKSRSTGKERDTESGNDYFGARYYASSMGRFMSPDWSDSPSAVPYAHLENPQSLNLYSYVLNNPLRGTDADGHECTVDGENHGGVWCFFHAIGLAETQHEQANDLRNYYADTAFYDAKGNKKSASDLSDQQILDFDKQNRGNNALAAAVGMPPGLMRMRLLSQAKDPGLKNIINDLYKDKSSFGDGGTADAIEYERATGQPVGGTFHSQKGQEYSNALQKAINSGRLDSDDKEIATNLLNRLQQSLNSTGR
jgi:RHS repeat-associated protein